MANCAYCGTFLANNDEAMNHAGECSVMNADVLFGECGRGYCEACGKDIGTIYSVYENRFLCLDCAAVWRKERDNETQNDSSNIRP